MNYKGGGGFDRIPAKTFFVNIYDMPTQDWQNLLLEPERTMFMRNSRS